MNEETKLQALLRLKRHETPPDGYFEDFLQSFHERQRQEMLKGGSLSLLWERIQTWVDGMRRPAVAWSLAAGYAVVVLVICFLPKPGPSIVVLATSTSAQAGTQTAVAPPPSRDHVLVSQPPVAAPPGSSKPRTVDPKGKVQFIGEERPAPPPVDEPTPTPPAQGSLREL